MNDIVNKIQKLLALANSDNKNEAELASKKAQELLIKHNISMSEVETANSDYFETNIDLPKRSNERKFIDALLDEYFFVFVYTDKRSNKIVFVGKKENVDVALYVRSFLEHTFKRLYKLENESQGWKGKHRESFYLGLYKGLKEKLEKQRQAIDTDNKLIVINKTLADHVYNNISNLKTAQHRIKASNRDAVENGFNHGKNLNISKGLGEKNQSNVFLIKNN